MDSITSTNGNPAILKAGPINQGLCLASTPYTNRHIAYPIVWSLVVVILFKTAIQAIRLPFAKLSDFSSSQYCNFLHRTIWHSSDDLISLILSVPILYNFQCFFPTKQIGTRKLVFNQVESVRHIQISNFKTNSISWKTLNLVNINKN